MSDFTQVPITDQFLLPNDQPPGRKSTIEFLLTAEMHNTVTGGVRSPIPVIARLDDQGRLSVVLDATDDPTTSPVGAHYRVTYRFEGQSTPARSFEIAVTYLAETDGLILSLIAPANTAPPATYGLTNVSVPLPLIVSLVSGVAVVEWDPSLGAVGDLPYRTADGVAWQTPSPMAHSHVESDVTRLVSDLSTLATEVADEATDRAGADTAEAAARTSADNDLTSALADEAATRASDDSAEATSRTTADNALATDLDAETTARSDADSVEAAARSSADDDLTAALASEAATRAANDTDEATARAAHAALAVTAHGGIVANTDSRLSDARTPLAHIHALVDVTGLVLALAGKSSVGHSHAESDTAGLVSDLAGKSAVGHSHVESDTTSLVSDLAGKAASSHSHAEADTTSLVSDLAGKSAVGHTHAEVDITSLVSDLSGKSAVGHTHAHADTTGQTVNDHHNKSHVHTGDGSGTVAYSSLSGLPTLVALGSANPSALGAVAVGTSVSGAHEDHVHPTTGVALVASDNAFSVGQGIRASLGTNANGLYVPWISGDTHPAILGGAGTSGNNQIGISGMSDSNTGVRGASNSGFGVEGTSVSATAIQATRSPGSAGGATALLLRFTPSVAGTTASGPFLTFQSYSSTSAVQTQGQIQSVWSDAANASYKGRLSIWANDTTTQREGLRVESSGTAPMLGFYGHTAAAQQTVSGSRSANAALASLLTALAALGLVVDSSSA